MSPSFLTTTNSGPSFTTPIVIVSGDTVEDATQRAAEAIQTYLDVLREEGIAAPEPKAVPVVVEAA